jgi:hypothetical protein
MREGKQSEWKRARVLKKTFAELLSTRGRENKRRTETSKTEGGWGDPRNYLSTSADTSLLNRS